MAGALLDVLLGPLQRVLAWRTACRGEKREYEESMPETVGFVEFAVGEMS